MKSGKTKLHLTYLLNVTRDAFDYNGFKTPVFRFQSKFDKYGKREEFIQAHDSNDKPDAIVVERSEQIWDEVMRRKPALVTIDKAHFADERLIQLFEALKREGYNVNAEAVFSNFRGDPFPLASSYSDDFSDKTVGDLVAKADCHISCVAKCTCIVYGSDNNGRCGKPANQTQRKLDGLPAHYDTPIIISTGKGGAGEYEGKHVTYNPVCDEHLEVPGKPKSPFVEGKPSKPSGEEIRENESRRGGLEEVPF